MSNVGPEYRSYLSIEHTDLVRLADIARRDREQFFAVHSDWAGLYADRVLCIALCQGGAAHYVDGVTGINDFDVYTFYRLHPEKAWYPRRIKSYDFGDPRFGQSRDKPDFVGRRVDCLGRSIDAAAGESPALAVQRYLREGRSTTARLLSQKPVVLLEPQCGSLIWPS
jgi:hypothetical protein